MHKPWYKCFDTGGIGLCTSGLWPSALNIENPQALVLWTLVASLFWVDYSSDMALPYSLSTAIEAKLYIIRSRPICELASSRHFICTVLWVVHADGLVVNEVLSISYSILELPPLKQTMLIMVPVMKVRDTRPSNDRSEKKFTYRSVYMTLYSPAHSCFGDRGCVRFSSL